MLTGIAKGIKYLHQGCNQRILHFNTKPAYILLDYNFKPKISYIFGLAQLCTRDQSIVTLTVTRGTMGYIALELLVEGARMSMYPKTKNQNNIYILRWVYEKIVTGQELELTRETAQREKNIVRKIGIVTLWCIHWNPANRPSMTKERCWGEGEDVTFRSRPSPYSLHQR
jgi:serine/threonine protein kinase